MVLYLNVPLASNKDWGEADIETFGDSIPAV